MWRYGVSLLPALQLSDLDRRKRRPAGGSGGPGGSVFLEASKHLGSFDFQTFVLRGKNGNDAKGK